MKSPYDSEVEEIKRLETLHEKTLQSTDTYLPYNGDQSYYYDQFSDSSPQDTASIEDQETAVPDTVGRGYTGKYINSDELKGYAKSYAKKYAKKQLLVAYSTIGGFIGILLFMFGLGAGALQAIHYANILAKPDEYNQNLANFRLGQLVLYQQHLGAAGDGVSATAATRLGPLGVKMIKDINAQLKKVGVTYTFDKTGRISTLDIEKSQHPKYSGQSDRVLRSNLAAEYGIPTDKISISNGRISVNVADSSIYQQRRIMRAQVRATNAGFVARAINFRVLTKYLKLPSLFHPWSRTSAEAQKGILGQLGVSDKLKAEEERLKKVAQVPESVKLRTAAVREKMNSLAKPTGAALTAAAGLCIVYDTAKTIPELNRAAIILPAVTSAADAMAVGSQTASEQDFVEKTVSAYAKLQTAADGTTPFDAAAIKQLQNQPGGVPPDPALVESLNPDNSASNLVKTLDETLQTNSVCSTTGQIIQGVVGVGLIVAGPGGWAIKSGMVLGSAAATYVALQGIMKLVNYYFVEQPIDTIAHQGALGGNIDGVGAIEAANISSRAQGHVRLSAADTAYYDTMLREEEAEEQSSKSMVARIFDIYDYRSVAGQAIDNYVPDVKRNVTTVATALFTLPKRIGGLFTTPQLVGAASANIPRYGVPVAQLEDDSLSNPGEISNEAAGILSGGRGAEMTERSLACFGVEITKTDGLWDAIKTTDVNPAAASYVEANCSDDSREFKVIATFIDFMGIARAMVCAGGDQAECSKMGIGVAAATSQAGPASGGGVVYGNYSLPTPQSWYDSNPTWFTKPHHDYPAADIPVPTGTEVYSMTSGTVIAGGAGGACGTGVIVDGDDGVRYTYCHGVDGSSVSGARPGDKVTAGQLIMHSASTGVSSGPHLHVQIKYQGNRCPQNLLDALGKKQSSLPDPKTLPTSGCTN